MSNKEFFLVRWFLSAASCLGVRLSTGRIQTPMRAMVNNFIRSAGHVRPDRVSMIFSYS